LHIIKNKHIGRDVKRWLLYISIFKSIVTVKFVLNIAFYIIQCYNIHNYM
jgi:hypothetical protein